MNDIKELDWNATLYLNDWGGDGVDLFFNIITHKLYSIPLYLLLFFFFQRKLGWRNLGIALIAIALMIAASDQLANLFKDGFERLRPFREPGLEGLISKVGDSGGTYGFYSAHASSVFALATFTILLFRKQQAWLTCLIIVWAITVAYSRVYLGLHYLGDVLMGGLMGILLGFLCYHLFAFAKAKYGVNAS
ncbi:phosphatase PAP2 family protein [Nonlabens marinus]|uniref:Putative membrane-associated phospholipid phosphatase n=1 Tax=Nonlabens marinus S1-08 TaxID=1454201 RepID=W8VRR4_9FLAO|nr:phosphatase PAP2 family protein [Nonlabens marinus]BAO55765.1 putative membrane-associated phospholipid phosphatase [Nonlabens marinus S1-08]